MEQSNYDVLLVECERRIHHIDREMRQLSGLRAALVVKRDGYRHLLRYGDYSNNIQRQPMLPGMADLPLKQPDGLPKATAKDTPPRKVPYVRILEDILREHGPLHIKDIVAIAKLHGVPFNGNKTHEEQARDRLYNSKRFHLLGGNVWCLPEHVETTRIYVLDGNSNRSSMAAVDSAVGLR